MIETISLSELETELARVEEGLANTDVLAPEKEAELHGKVLRCTERLMAYADSAAGAEVPDMLEAAILRLETAWGTRERRLAAAG